jgi:hypothetical protein
MTSGFPYSLPRDAGLIAPFQVIVKESYFQTLYGP